MFVSGLASIYTYMSTVTSCMQLLGLDHNIFVVFVIRCRKYFIHLFFLHNGVYENIILMTKMSRITVYTYNWDEPERAPHRRYKCVRNILLLLLPIFWYIYIYIYIYIYVWYVRHVTDRMYTMLCVRLLC